MVVYSAIVVLLHDIIVHHVSIINIHSININIIMNIAIYDSFLNQYIDNIFNFIIINIY